jgi:hypothetical protein
LVSGRSNPTKVSRKNPHGSLTEAFDHGTQRGATGGTGTKRGRETTVQELFGLDEAEDWATWGQFEADWESTLALIALQRGDPAEVGDLASYRRLRPGIAPPALVWFPDRFRIDWIDWIGPSPAL